MPLRFEEMTDQLLTELSVWNIFVRIHEFLIFSQQKENIHTVGKQEKMCNDFFCVV